MNQVGIVKFFFVFDDKEAFKQRNRAVYRFRFVSDGCLWVGAGAKLFSVAAVLLSLFER